MKKRSNYKYKGSVNHFRDPKVLIERGMKMVQGNIRMKKSWLNEGMLKDPRLWTFWSYCMLNARLKPGTQFIRGKQVELGRGEFATTSRDMERDLDLLKPFFAYGDSYAIALEKKLRKLMDAEQIILKEVLDKIALKNNAQEAQC